VQVLVSAVTPYQHFQSTCADCARFQRLHFKRRILSRYSSWCYRSFFRQGDTMLHPIVGNLWLKRTVLCLTATRQCWKRLLTDA